ncbi:MAG: UPF0280 family protein [Pseudomonadota bacterium]
MTTAAASWINNAERLHLQHGPIDLIVEAHGPGSQSAYRAAARRFDTVLQELVDELRLLRTPTAALTKQPCGSTALRMTNAVEKFTGFTTPMIAVAGSVADEVLAAMLSVATLDRAYVNNGGDIALYVASGQQYKAGIVSDPRSAAINATLTLCAADAVGGIATSGCHGRSLSSGIADSVTVLAACAAMADTAATLIANSVDLPDCSAVTKVPAHSIDPDSDLGAIPVTVEVDQLPTAQVERALNAGVDCAQAMMQRGLIHSAYLHLQGRCKVAGAGSIDRHPSASLIEESLCPI